MKWRDSADGRYKVPDLTKGWKVKWLLGGMIFGTIAPLAAFIWYRKKIPNIPTVSKVATKWAVYGFALSIVLYYLLSQI